MRARVRCDFARMRVGVSTLACRVRLFMAVCLSSCKLLLNMCGHLHITLWSEMPSEATSVAGLGVLTLVTPIIGLIFLSSKSGATNGRSSLVVEAAAFSCEMAATFLVLSRHPTWQQDPLEQQLCQQRRVLWCRGFQKHLFSNLSRKVWAVDQIDSYFSLCSLPEAMKGFTIQ